MLQLPQYPTYASLPSGTHGDLAEVTTGAAGVYQYVGQVNNEPVGLWLPSELVGRLADYVRKKVGMASATISDGGSGYSIGEVVQPTGGTATGFITVDAVSSGAITAATITFTGIYDAYPSPLAANPVTTTTGSGSGAEFDLVMQNQEAPCKISVGVGGDLVADCIARGWLEYKTGSALSPVDIAGAIEFDSVGTALSNSGLIFTGLSIGATAKEYLLISQTEATAPSGNAFLITSVWGTTANKVVRQSFRRSTADNTAYLAYSTGGTIALVGRNYLTYSAYETLFSRWSNGPTSGVNAEINQIWKTSEGQAKTNPNALLEEFTASTANAQLHLNCINFAGSTGCVGRIREFHLFELS